MSSESNVTVLKLNKNWTFTKRGDEKALQATVPGDVLTDLVLQKIVPDPFYRDNEKLVKWIGEADWIYETEFSLPKSVLSKNNIDLEFLGLDTLCEIHLNGKKIGNTDNMFRKYSFPLKGKGRSLLKPDSNALKLIFSSPIKHTQTQMKKRALPAWFSTQVTDVPWNYLRKEACNFGWDWGVKAVTSGIWKDVQVVAYDDLKIDHVAHIQKHRKESVELQLATFFKKGSLMEFPKGVHIVAELFYKGSKIVSKTSPCKDYQSTIKLSVENPHLWWPNNMGEQHLYELKLLVTDSSQNTIESYQSRVGFRTLVLDRHKDKWGESFQFVVNGKPFFAKGANWIPVDALLGRRTRELYASLLKDTVLANMNMLRVWGGGIYEDDLFYDLCDELGICVWQDFMFACATYPADDPIFMANVKDEATEQVQRLHAHPSLALLCGNNELEQGLVGPEWTDKQMSWKDYEALFDTLLGEVASKEAPQISYWPGSPHSSVGERANHSSPLSGDAHLWDVWHGKKPFEWYRTCEHRFNSEFGFQSFPEPRTINSFTIASDRNVTSPIMELHQRSGIGNATIMHYMLDWFRLPVGFDNTVWASQILQGMAIKYAVEHWRRSMPRGMGTLYWQINDYWPVASWASIDSLGRWKALHYMAKKFFEPVLISGFEDSEKRKCEIHLTNDKLVAISGEANWTITDIEGAVLKSGIFPMTMGAQKTGVVGVVDLVKENITQSNSEIIMWIEVSVENKIVGNNLVLFARPKGLTLSEKPSVSMKFQKISDCKWNVILSTEKPTLWNFLSTKNLDLRMSDNFFHMRPGKVYEIEIETTKGVDENKLKREISVKSLVDLDKL